MQGIVAQRGSALARSRPRHDNGEGAPLAGGALHRQVAPMPRARSRLIARPSPVPSCVRVRVRAHLHERVEDHSQLLRRTPLLVRPPRTASRLAALRPPTSPSPAMHVARTPHAWCVTAPFLSAQEPVCPGKLFNFWHLRRLPRKPGDGTRLAPHAGRPRAGGARLPVSRQSCPHKRGDNASRNELPLQGGTQSWVTLSRF